MSEETAEGYKPQYNVNDLPDGDAPQQSSAEGLWIELDGKRKTFKFKPKGATEHTFINQVKGFRGDIVQTWDAEGNPNYDVPPGWRLAVFLETKDFGLVQIKISSKAAYTSMVKALQEIPRGTICAFMAVPFDKGCFVNAATWSGQAWNDVRGAALPGETSNDRYESAVKIVRGLDGYNELKSDAEPHNRARAKKQASGQGAPSVGPEQMRFIKKVLDANWPPFAANSAAYEAWFQRIMQDASWRLDLDCNEATWVDFCGYVDKVVEAGAPLPKELRTIKVYNPLADEEDGAPAPTPQPDPVQTSAPVASTPVSTAPVTAAPVDPATPSAEAKVLGTPTGDVPPGVSAYGWVPKRWFMPRQMATSATDRQTGLFKDKIASLGMVSTGHQVRWGVLTALGFPKDAVDTLAAYLVTLDFLAEANEGQLAQAEADGADFDPFGAE